MPPPLIPEESESAYMGLTPDDSMSARCGTPRVDPQQNDFIVVNCQDRKVLLQKPKTFDALLAFVRSYFTIADHIDLDVHINTPAIFKSCGPRLELHKSGYPYVVHGDVVYITDRKISVTHWADPVPSNSGGDNAQNGYFSPGYLSPVNSGRNTPEEFGTW